jgi:putative nucleotidyltransferase with HDIG domain
MPDQNKGPDSSRFEKLTKSVLESDHPVFGKIRKELPNLNQRQSALGHPALELLRKWNEKFNLKQKGLIFLAAAILSFFIYRQITDPFLDYKLGDIAQRHLIAQRTMEMVDEETTEAKRKSSVESVLSVYDHDRRIFFQTSEKIRKAFAMLRKQHQAVLAYSEKKASQGGELEKSEVFIEAKKAFSTALEIELSDAQFDALVRLKFSKRDERILVYLLAGVNKSLIVSNKELLKSEQGRGITINKIGDEEGRAEKDRPEKDRAEQVFTNISSIIDVDTARAEIGEQIKPHFKGVITPYAERIAAIAKKLVVPNLTLNRQETEKRKQLALEGIKPVLVKINKGESIVRYGETINKRHLTILQQLEKNSHSDNFRFQFILTAIFLSIILFAVVEFLSGGLKAYQYQPKDFAAIGVLMVATILVLKGVQFIAAEALIEKFPQIPFDFYYFLVPAAAGPVILRMLMDKEPALVYSVVLAIVGGILLERNFFYAAYILSSALLASALATHIKTRSVIYRAGMITGALNVVMIACIVANTRNAASLKMLWEDIGWIFWAGMLSGVLMSMIVVSLVPLIELISGRTSDLRLLELANMNHPLLRDLMVKAPGTYHHSIVIGSLVEAAAEAIGANPLMARVMAYYHDVGKMERPLYFIENQGGGYNKHDALQPHMSAMIIREHVKKGQELGEKHKLPQPIIDAMSEHHGSSTIWYFYNKARSQAEEPEFVLESDYKYDGMKPQSKETALVMLGDVVEAATRSVADPSPLRLSGVVKNILNKYFAEGQLSECDLTLRDLDSIAKSFLDVLLGIYHARIEYGVPSLRENVKKKHGGSDSKGSGRASGGAGVAAAGGAAPFTKPYQVPESGGSGSKKS